MLKALFGKTVIPQAVHKEITAKKQKRLIFTKLKWIETKNVKNTEMTTFLEKLIDKGETEAIILARELNTTLLIDDAKARKHAQLLNIEVVGTLGLLKIAKKADKTNQ
jgi:predicted nucleic acid-binding protein